MTNAQKEFIKRIVTIVGIVLYFIFIIVCGCIGNIWARIAFGVAIATLVPMVGYIAYINIAKFIWHWRLMGECKNDFETKLLNHWWFWMTRSDSWHRYIQELIYDEYGEDDETRAKVLEFYVRCIEVNKPKGL